MNSKADNKSLLLEAFCASAAQGNGLNFLVAFLQYGRTYMRYFRLLKAKSAGCREWTVSLL
jgi:hypothetical protein